MCLLCRSAKMTHERALHPNAPAEPGLSSRCCFQSIGDNRGKEKGEGRHEGGSGCEWIHLDVFSSLPLHAWARVWTQKYWDVQTLKHTCCSAWFNQQKSFPTGSPFPCSWFMLLESRRGKGKLTILFHDHQLHEIWIIQTFTTPKLQMFLLEQHWSQCRCQGMEKY